MIFELRFYRIHFLVCLFYLFFVGEAGADKSFIIYSKTKLIGMRRKQIELTLCAPGCIQ